MNCLRKHFILVIFFSCFFSFFYVITFFLFRFAFCCCCCCVCVGLLRISYGHIVRKVYKKRERKNKALNWERALEIMFNPNYYALYSNIWNKIRPNIHKSIEQIRYTAIYVLNPVIWFYVCVHMMLLNQGSTYSKIFGTKGHILRL